MLPRYDVNIDHATDMVWITRTEPLGLAPQKMEVPLEVLQLVISAEMAKKAQQRMQDRMRQDLVRRPDAAALPEWPS